MSLFRSMMSVNFRVNEKGETTFFFPVVAGVWCPHKGYRITSDEDVRKLKRYLEFYFWVLTAGFALMAAIVAVRLIEGIVYSWMLPVLLSTGAVLVVFGGAFARVLVPKVVGKYERTEERLRFRQLQRIQCESQSWKTLFFTELIHLLFVAFGLYLILSRFDAGVGILFVIIFAPLATQIAYQLSLKRQGRGGSAGE